MSKVLAEIDNSAAAGPVLAVAAAVAELFEAEVEALHLREDGVRTARAAASAAGIPLRTIEDDGIERLLGAARQPDVAAVVIGARGTHTGRRPAGHVALELIVSLEAPLVVVPPATAAAPVVRRILVPLDGSRATAAALESTFRLACDRDLDVVVLHVRGEGSLPLFADQPHHEAESWAREFLARHCPCPGRGPQLEVRIGVPGEHVLRVAEEAGVDLVALGWSRDLSAGRAEVVREVLERSPVPVLLVPVTAAGRTAERSRPAVAPVAS